MAHHSVKRIYIGTPGITLKPVVADYNIVFDFGIFEDIVSDHISINYLGDTIWGSHVSINSLFTGIKADYSFNNSVLVSADHNFITSLLVSKIHKLKHNIGNFNLVYADHISIYDIFERVSIDHISIYDIIYKPTLNHIVKYSINCKIQSEFIIKYGIRISVGINHVLLNTLYIANDFTQVNTLGFLIRNFTFNWGLRPVINNDQTFVNTIFQSTIIQDFILLNSSLILNEFNWILNFVISNDQIFSNTIFQSTIIQDFILLNSNLISNEFNYLYSLKKNPSLNFTQRNNLSFSIATEMILNYSLSVANIVNNNFIFSFVLSSETQNIINTVSAIVESQSVQFRDLVINADDNSYCISFTATLGDINDWIICEAGKNIEIEVNGVWYKFIIDYRERSLKFEKNTYSVFGRSPTSKLSKGSANAITKTWPATSALSVVDELCATYGIDYSFLISNWNFPEGLLSVNSTFPIQVLKLIADASGAFLQTTPNGELLISYLYNVPPPQYEITESDFVVSGAKTIHSLIETKEIKPCWDSVLVLDEPESKSEIYSLEQISDKNGIIVLAAYVYPFVESINFQTSYNYPTLSVSEDGIVIETIQEQVEIINGVGRLLKPILSINAFDYGHNVNLGSISADGLSITTAIKGQSILNLTYDTQYIKFSLTNSESEKVQFYFEEAS